MEEQGLVSFEMYEATVAAILSQISELSELFGALSRVLIERGIVPKEVLVNAIEATHNEEREQKTREAIAKLRGSSPIEDILKDFEGPIQKISVLTCHLVSC